MLHHPTIPNIGNSPEALRQRTVAQDEPFFALSRPDMIGGLWRGDDRLGELLRPSRSSHSAGSSIISAKTENRRVYRIRSGWCAQVRQLRGGRRQILGVLLPGDLFGLSSMFTTSELCEVSALSSVTLDEIGGTALRSAMRADSSLSLRVNWQMLENERRLRNWMLALGQASADERLALLFLDLRGRLMLAGTIAWGATTMPLPMTQEQIGDLLGLTAVHVNRKLQNLRSQGMISRTCGHVDLIDIPALFRLAQPMMDGFERTNPAFGSKMPEDDRHPPHQFLA
jgi:CRP/FNR family transcriptional regulator